MFSGIGGFSEGALRSDKYEFNLLFGADKDSSMVGSWSSNRPDVPFLEQDLSHDSLPSFWNSAERFGASQGTVDILIGSPPCQMLSQAGKRLVGADTNLLFTSMLSAVDRWRPKAFALENVPRFFTAYDGAYLQTARSVLKNLDYTPVSRSLDASNYGVPQIRRRGFLVAVRNDLLKDAALLPEITHGDYDLQQTDTRLNSKVVVEEAIGDLPSIEAGGSSIEYMNPDFPSAFLDFVRDGSSELANHRAWNHSQEMIERIQTVEEGSTPQGSPGHPANPKKYFRNAYARLDRRRPAATITTNFHNPGSGRFTHYSDHRTITVREAARIQSFPDSFRFEAVPSVASTHIGNAVPPLLAKVILEQLALHITD